MILRIWLFGSRLLAPGAAGALAADIAVVTPAAIAGAAAGAGADMAASTSRRRIRPCGPLPVR
ncbi:MAG: hypothetical protein ACPHE2_06015, partial [Candidatus Puniceispirillaceae bacterium]